MRRKQGACLRAVALAGCCLALPAQWKNFHPRVEGYRHHIYLEGYELPFLSSGPMDPAPLPDGKALVIAARGWLWRFDLQTCVARRLTRSAGCDHRPAVSADGRSVVFVRDEAHTTRLVLLDLVSGQERELVRSEKLDLDPAFSPDGRTVYYCSSEAGDIDLWKVDVTSGVRTRLTTESGLEMAPRPLPDGSGLIYIHKARGGTDQIRQLRLADGSVKVLHTGSILSMTRPAVSPDGRTVALALPGHDDHGQMYLMDLGMPDQRLNLTRTSAQPLAPAWSPDGTWVYFVEDSGTHTFDLFRVPALGGPTEKLMVKTWDYGVPTGRVRLEATLDVGGTPARFELTDGKGHPLVPQRGPIRFDWQTGRTYFHAQGAMEIEVPVGEVRVAATHGLLTPEARVTGTVAAGATLRLDLPLKPVANPRAQGWFGGDLHFHLNYGGPLVLGPPDLVDLMQAEDLDVATPMSANLHNRLTDFDLLGWKRDEAPWIHFGQEVRSHFQGHVGLIGMDRPSWPWFYGPGYPVVGKADFSNAQTLANGRGLGAFGTYVHPVDVEEVFRPDRLGGIPTGFVADAVNGRVDGLELTGLWVNEPSTCEVYYRVLNLGIPMVPSAGTDAFPNFYRCSVPGSNRLYAKVDGPMTLQGYMAAVKSGRSFATTGPMAFLRIGGQEPGSVVPAGRTDYTFTLATALPLDVAEVIVNGQVVTIHKGPFAPGSHTLQGSLKLPAAGWVAARAFGAKVAWPAMNSRIFAHTAPVWIGAKGSVDPECAKAAAGDLLTTLAVAHEKVVKGYGPKSSLIKEYETARRKLELAVRTGRFE